MTGAGPSLWELKQAAKWSRGIDERRRAVEEMAKTYREGAVNALAEIKITAVHDEIRMACIEAIRSVTLDNGTGRKNNEERPRAARKKASGRRKGARAKGKRP